MVQRSALCSMVLWATLAACCGACTREVAGPPQVVAGLGPVANANGGGDWESSGGTGVACFRDAGSAAEFDAGQLRGEPVSDALIASIESLVTLEYWERDAQSFIEGATSEAILSDVMGRLRLATPMFYKQLESIGPQIRFAGWKPTGRLDNTLDAAPLHRVRSPEHPLCRQIQLVVRQSRFLGVGDAAAVTVYFDPRLRARLDPINRALLDLHERIYVAGRAVGHGDSLRTRQLTLALLDESSWDSPEQIDGRLLSSAEKAGLTAMRLQNLLNAHFGDYVFIFASALVPKNPDPFTAGSRLRSLMTLVQKGRDANRRCEERGIASLTGSPSAIRTARRQLALECHEAFKDLILQPGELTGEEAFIYLHRWEMPRFQFFASAPNNEFFYFDWDTPEMRDYSRGALQAGCDGIARADESAPPGVAAARSYCDEMRARGQVGPSPPKK